MTCASSKTTAPIIPRFHTPEVTIIASAGNRHCLAVIIDLPSTLFAKWATSQLVPNLIVTRYLGTEVRSRSRTVWQYHDIFELVINALLSEHIEALKHHLNYQRNMSLSAFENTLIYLLHTASKAQVSNFGMDQRTIHARPGMNKPYDQFATMYNINLQTISQCCKMALGANEHNTGLKLIAILVSQSIIFANGSRK